MFLQVAVLCPPEWAETVASLLLAAGCTGTAERLPLAREEGLREVIGYADALHGTPPGVEGAVRAGLERLAAGSGEPGLAVLEVDLRLLPDQPWEDLWKTRWRPFRVAGFVVRPTWREGRLRPGDVEVVLDPGSAFGTGLHVTTRQALRGLAAWLAGRPPEARAGLEIVDAGTGSGILALAALKAGVGRVVAFDRDERSVLVAGRNLAAAGVRDQVRLLAATPAGLQGSWPLILANLETDPHLEEAANLAALLAPGGTLVACGVHRARVAEVLAAYARVGLAGRLLSVRGKWAALGVKPTNRK